MTKIANKLFSEAFADAWVWCHFWARDQGLAFSIRHCSPALAWLGSARLSLAMPGSLGALRQAGRGWEQRKRWKKAVPAVALVKCQPKTSLWGALKCQV